MDGDRECLQTCRLSSVVKDSFQFGLNVTGFEVHMIM